MTHLDVLTKAEIEARRVSAEKAGLIAPRRSGSILLLAVGVALGVLLAGVMQ